MKHLPNIAATLLGLAFLTFGLNYFLHFLPMGEGPPEGSPPALFYAAIIPTGYLTFVKTFELLGAILVIIPKTRNFGLLILGPIVINILAVNIFLKGGSAVLSPPVLVVSILSFFLLITERKKFSGLLK